MNSTISAEQKICSVEGGGTMARLRVLLKICPFAQDIVVFWILIERTNSKHPFKIRYSGKDLTIETIETLEQGVKFVQS